MNTTPAYLSRRARRKAKRVAAVHKEINFLAAELLDINIPIGWKEVIGKPRMAALRDKLARLTKEDAHV